jgi:hypothetical protein
MKLAAALALMLAIALTLPIRTAHAALVELDLAAPGDGLLLGDSTNGLEWLDLTETLGLTYDAVQAGAGGFTTTGGFRFATQAEVVALFNEAGIVAITGSYTADNYAGATLLMSLLGCTGNCAKTTPYLQGMADFDLVDPLLADSPFVQRRTSFGTARASIGVGREKATFANPAVGSYLVRSLVLAPEPHASLLLVLALGALAVRRRRALA